MRQANIYPFGNGRAFQTFAGCKKMFDFPEYPGIADSSPANHDTVHLVFHAPGCSLFHAVYIAVAENRDMDAGIALDVTNQCPVGKAFIHLRAGAPMYSQR